jgi:hypothetical protein
MADTERNIEVKLDSEAKNEIATLREQQRRINKDIKRLQESVKDEGKIEDWKMLYTLKQEIIERLAKQGVSWKKFIATPDYFEYAWYVGSGGAGKPRRLKTSMTKPSSQETRTDEATMIKDAAIQRSKMVRRKSRKTSSTSTPTVPTGKSEAIAKANIS